MWFLHYIIPAVVFYYKRDKILFWALMAGNFLDLDKIIMRMLGIVPWFGSICPDGVGTCSSIGNYPLHGLIALISLSALFVISGTLLFYRRENKKFYFAFWLFAGALLHLLLDYIQHITGIII